MQETLWQFLPVLVGSSALPPPTFLDFAASILDCGRSPVCICVTVQECRQRENGPL
jgi:hypothetical protein